MVRLIYSFIHLFIHLEKKFSFLGNCWFLAAIGAITFQKDIMDQVIPDNQSFDKDYAGIFHFRVSEYSGLLKKRELEIPVRGVCL